VYNAMATNTTMNEKVNALLYFESIIVNSNVSNRLINSAFMNLLVKMMKTIKSPMIRIRLCSVIGLLIRHSTVIENELAESDICNQLIEAMKDKNEKVRKKAIAALGEYLFYAATQLDDEQADPIWEISDEAINVIIRSLRSTEDETVRFYSCKTLENIAAQSTSAGHRFATLESINYLLNIFLAPSAG
jgi:serine/threonine-protein kinase ULK4